MMQVEVIMRETIKPSSPTPLSKNTLKLSVIDKVMPPVYIRYITYYSPSQTKNILNLDQTFKDSLSKALTIFYPFAGRISHDSTIDCNDNGVLFVTTRVHCELVDLLSSPKPRIELLDKIMPPMPPFCPDESTDKPSIVAFQLNKFICGGIALSFCFNHLVIDAITNVSFVKCWSEIAAKVEMATSYTICPAVSMYPQGTSEEKPKNLTSELWNFLMRAGISGGTIRRFKFENGAILKIKENSVSDHVPIPTRVGALTGFIWKHTMLACDVVSGYEQSSALVHSVDLRRRMPEGIMPTEKTVLPVGNLFWTTVAHYRPATKNDAADRVKELVSSVGQSVDKIKNDFIPKLFNNRAYDTVCEFSEEIQEITTDVDINSFALSSWHKIGLSDINFGWGKPIWVSFAGGDVDTLGSNVVFLIDGGSDSIEAWVTLGKKQMEVLENNSEFLAFASLNPAILVNPI